jgi:subtilisin-like proprotein convertase family protein
LTNINQSIKNKMKIIQSTIVIFIAAIFATSTLLSSCSKDEDKPQQQVVTQTIVLSPEYSYEQSPQLNTGDASISAIGVTMTSINVPIDRIIKDHKKIVIEMKLKHPTASDLSFILVSPDNTRSRFVYRAGGTSDFSENNILTFNATSVNILDQGLISNGAISAGNYAPSFGSGWTSVVVSSPIFKEFQEKNIKGDWILEIRDHLIGDTGKLYNWKIKFLEGALK